MTRDRTKDLDTLADAVIQRLEDGGDCYWGLDGKRPLGSCSPDSDALCLLGIESSDDGEWTVEQVEYGERLWGDLIPHIQARWAAFREAERA